MVETVFRKNLTEDTIIVSSDEGENNNSHEMNKTLRLNKYIYDAGGVHNLE